jgi:hypothetical protein
MLVSLKDLLEAFEFVCAGGGGEHEAFLCRQSGKLYCHSELCDDLDILPDDNCCVGPQAANRPVALRDMTQGEVPEGCVESPARNVKGEPRHPREKLTLAGSRRADRITSWLQDAVIKIGSALSEPDDLEYEEFWCQPL